MSIWSAFGLGHVEKDTNKCLYDQRSDLVMLYKAARCEIAPTVTLGHKINMCETSIMYGNIIIY